MALPKNWKATNPATAHNATANQEGAAGFVAGLRTVGPHHPSSRAISKPKMKLLVLASTPPPVHGQSVMVAAAVRGLPTDGIELEHVDLKLSRDAADIGRWQPGKLLRLLDAWEGGHKNAKTNVFSIIAIGGTGKTALLCGFLNELHARGWAGASHVYAWSAYSQGSGENRNTSAAEFINKALEWFGYAGPAIPSEHDRGVKLGEIVGAKRSIKAKTAFNMLHDGWATGLSPSD